MNNKINHHHAESGHKVPGHKVPGHKVSLDVIWCTGTPPEILELKFSYDFCLKQSHKFCQDHLNLTSWQKINDAQKAVSCLQSGSLTGNIILFVTEPELVISPDAVQQMAACIKDSTGAVLPVLNNTPVAIQSARLPAVYLNLSSYLEVAKWMASNPGKQIIPGRESDFDLSCALIPGSKTDLLAMHIKQSGDIKEGLSSFLKEMAEKEHLLIEETALVHSFGLYFSGKRQDLVDLVPHPAKNILDIGCAHGGFGELIGSQRSNLHLTGVEMNEVMAQNALPHYDQLHTMKVEDVRFEKMFDHINCGDIIEHLYDPWTMLKLFSSLLVKKGSLVVSLPNAGHWTIVKDMAAGDFEYLPVGMLCMTHIRWFTEKSIRQALDEAGFYIDKFQREQIPPTPRGKAFIDLLCCNDMGDQKSLITNQFTIRAIKK